MSLEDLYRQVIIDHYRNPRNRAPLDAPTSSADGVNPLCGDEVHVDVAVDDDGAIQAISVQGQGCSISQASASMMSDAVKGRSGEDLAKLIRDFRGMMTIESEHDPIDPERPGAVLGDLEALAGVKQYPVRIKCANLPWTTLEQALSGG